MYIQLLNHQESIEETYELASFGQRLLARLIDGFIILIPSILIPLISRWLYWSLMQSGSSQATLGQQAMGIKVIGGMGERVSFGMATGRFFGGILNLLTCILMFFFNDERQCPYDYISGCIVVNKDPINYNKVGILMY